MSAMAESLPATPLPLVDDASAASTDNTDNTDTEEPMCEQDPLAESLACAERSSKLHDAVRKNDIVLAESLLGGGAALVSDEDSDGKLPIHVAAHLCLHEMVSLLIKHNADLDALDRAGRTQLLCEAKSGNVETVQFLLLADAKIDAKSLGDVTALLAAAGAMIDAKKLMGKTENRFAADATVDERSSNEETALVDAAERRLVEVVRLLVEGGADVHAMDKGGRTPLSAAAKCGRLESVQLLVEHGAILRSRTQRLGRTPMLLAASNGHTNVVAFLLARDKALISDRDDNNWTPLHAAAGNGRDDIVDLLLASDAPIDDNKPQGATPLFLAVEHNHQRTVELLIKRKANVNAKQAQGRTPLLAAVSSGSLRVVQLLIKAGASVREQDDAGNTPLLVAAAKGLFDIASVLVGTDSSLVNEKSGRGVTPLMAAARFGRDRIIELLVESGANLNDKQKYGRTALMLAISNKRIVTAQKLIDHGADVNATDSAGWTPLHIAAACKQVVVMQRLVSRGAVADAKSLDGATPLDLAVKQGDGVQALLAKDAPTDYAILSAKAARYGRTLLLLSLLKDGKVDLRAHASEIGAVVLLALVRFNYSGIFKLQVRNSTPMKPTTAEATTDETKTDGDDTPLLLATLKMLQELCRGANESQSMFVLVADRLVDVCALLLGPSAPLPTKSVVDALAEIVFRFARQLLLYRRQPMIARFVAASKNCSNLRDLHEEIDNLMAKTGLRSTATVHATWRTVLHDDRVTQQEWYLQEVGNGDALAKELTTPDKRDSAIAHLALMSSSRGRADRADKEAMERAICRLVGRSDLVKANPPAWFISLYDIELAKARYARSNRFSSGRWLRTAVAIAQCNLELAQFQSVAAQWKSLGHPNVIDLFGAVHVSQPRLFVCSEHKTLREYLRPFLRNSPSRAKILELLYGAAQGLLFLHERGIVHGNLTTDCIFVGDDGKPKIGGLDRDSIVKGGVASKSAATATRTRDATAWLAPERVRGEPASFASDVYAFSVCIVDILTMNDPWRTRLQIPLHYYLIRDSSPPALGVEIRSIWRLVSEMCAPNKALRVNIGYVVPNLGYLAEKVKADELCKRKANAAAASIMTALADLKVWREPDTGRTIEKNLKILHGRCSDFPAAQKLAEHIHKRLCDTFERMLAKCVAPSSLEADKFMRIVSGFADYLTDCGSDKSMAIRMANQKIVFGHHVFHTRIDSLLDLLKVPKSSEHDWRCEYNSHVTNMSVAERSCQGGAGMQHIVTVHSVYPSRRDGVGPSSSVKVLRSGASSNDHEWRIHLSEIVYNPGDKFAEGSFGKIFRGVWMQGTQVVIKFVGDNDVSASKDEEKKTLDPRLFLHEVRIWYPLRHPHVVRLWGAGDTGKPCKANKAAWQQYFVCEFASNGTLTSYVTALRKSVANGTLTERKLKRQMWELLCDAALGLQYCHEANVIHNDLNGSNILVGDDGKAKLTDFGLSCMPGKFELEFTAKERLGLIQWKAPEYIETGVPTFESDIYSLAMCIVEVMKGGSPWGIQTDDSEVKKRVKIGNLPPRPDTMDDREWGLVQLMTKLDPKQRVGIAFVVTKIQEIIAELGADASESATTARH